MSEKYSDGLLDEKFSRMDERFDEQNVVLSRIEDQTKKTNGSIAAINRWRERLNGGMYVAGVFIVMIVLPILTFALITLINIDSKVSQAVQSALSGYNIKVEP